MKPLILPFAVALLATLGCERHTIVIETAPATPSPATEAKTRTLETSRLGASVEKYEREPTAGHHADVKKALAGSLPTGLTIAGENVRPPIADPFIFVADLGSNALSLSGSVPSENARKEVRDLSRQLFRRPGLDDRLELASGAPKNWDDAVAAALRALSQLESGKIALSGLAVTIEGVAPDKGTAVAVSYQLRRDLPALFSTSESISWKEAAASQDIAARVIPRIKDSAHADSQLPKGGLPNLLPLLDNE